MSMRMTRHEARILSITKEELKFCSTKRIEAKLKTYSGEIVDVFMADSPAVITDNSILISKIKRFFYDVWHNAKEGDLVMLVHFDEGSCDYFYCLWE